MSSKLDTHFYDGKLDAKLEKVNASTDDKNDMFKAVLFPLINDSANETKRDAIAAINLMMTDYKNNYDISDNLFACDILYLICRKLSEKKHVWIDLQNVIIQQIGDICGGSCPQGRVKRLMQLYYILYDMN